MNKSVTVLVQWWMFSQDKKDTVEGEREGKKEKRKKTKEKNGNGVF